MRKHFLILMLLALLPFTAWAVDYVVKPYNMSKTYGTRDADVHPANLMYSVSGTTDETDLAAIASLLQISRNGVNANENVGEYSYTFKSITATQIAGKTWTNQPTRVLIDGSATLSIEPLNIGTTNPTITVTNSPANLVYNGQNKSITYTVKMNLFATTDPDDATTLASGTDYVQKSITPSTVKNAGNYAIKIEGKGNFTGEYELADAFAITAKSINNNSIRVVGLEPRNAQNVDYLGIVNDIVVYDDAISTTVPLTATQYNAGFVGVTEVINAGKYTVRLTGSNNYQDTKDFDFYVLGSKNLSTASIALTDPTETFTYDGTAKTPALTVTVGTDVLTSGTDYEVAWANNTNAGQATATITGLGDYADPTVSKTFNINIAKAKLTVTVADASKDFGVADATLAPTINITAGKVGGENPTVELDIQAHSENYLEGGYANVLRAKVKTTGAPAQLTVNKNYEVAAAPTSTWGKLTINRKNIADITYGFNVEDKVYDGVAPTFDYAGNILYGETALTQNDYAVKYVNTGNAAETATAPAVVGNYQLVFTGAGNYTGTKTFNYEITKADLYITPDAGQGKSVSVAADPTLTWHIEGLVPADANKTIAQILGVQTPVLTRTAGNDAGQKLISVQANGSGIATTSTNAAITAENYFVKPNPTPVYFTISQNALQIAVKAQTILYGDAFPATATSANRIALVEPTGLIAGDALTDITIKVYATDEDGEKTGEAIPTATAAQKPGTYVLEATNPTFSTSGDNYAINIINNSLTINPFKLRIKANPQNVTTATVEDLLDEIADATHIASNVTLVKVTGTGAGEVETPLVNAASLPYNASTTTPWVPEFIESLSWEKNEGQTDYTFGMPGFIQVHLNDGLAEAYPEYIFETSNGAVTFTDAEAGALVLNRAATGENSVKSILEAYNGGTNAIQIKDSRTLNANQWYSFVLPFATTAREISEAFGYAVVDVPSVSNGDANVVKFSLTVGAVRANELFLVKTDTERNLTTHPLNFNVAGVANRTIDYDPNFNVTDAGGNVYQGVYETTPINDASQWYLSGGDFWNAGTNPTQVAALGGYVYATAGAHATILIEEADGSTTAINAVTGEQKNYSNEGWYTVNGVKLQSMPTEKGVYIQNGKKVVLK